MADINWHSFFFLFFGAFVCAFALAVVFTSNIVRMAFYLVISLGATAGLFFLAGADFVGAMQLMIYVGGTMVLLVFGVMLTAQGPFITLKTRGGEWVLAAIVGGSLLALLIPTAFSDAFRVDIKDYGAADDTDEERRKDYTKKQEDEINKSRPTAAKLGLSLLGIRPDRDDAEVEAKKAAKAGDATPAVDTTVGMAGYLLPFEIVSVHLLVVLIGAAYLARTKKRKNNT